MLNSFLKFTQPNDKPEDQPDDKTKTTKEPTLNTSTSIIRSGSLDSSFSRQDSTISQQPVQLLNQNILGNFLAKTAITAQTVNLQEEDQEKRTIVHRACFQLKYDILDSLRDKLSSLDVNKHDIYGNTPLILACKYPVENRTSSARINILNLLLEKGADIHVCEPINGWNCLHWCCFNGDDKAVELLLSKGAIFFRPCIEGHFPIDYAGKKECRRLVKLLIKDFIDFMKNVGTFQILEADEEKVEGEDEVKPNEENEVEHVLNGNNNDDDKNANININVLNPIKDQLNNNSDAPQIKFNAFAGLAGVGTKKIIEDKPTTQQHEDKEGEGEEEDKEKKEKQKERRRIINNSLKEISKYLQTACIRLYAHHCLYWGCYFFKIRTKDQNDVKQEEEIYLTELLDTYEVSPIFEIYCLKQQTPIHAACSSGNSKAVHLLLPKYKIIKDRNLNDINPTYFLKNNKGSPISLPSITSQIKSDDVFKTFERGFRKYFIKGLKHLFFPEYRETKKELKELLDSEHNNPFNCSAKYSQYKFIKEFQDNEIFGKFHDHLIISNKFGISGYYYLKDDGLQNEFLTKADQTLFPIPPMVLELNKNEKTIDSINLIMKIVLAENLIATLMEHRDKKCIYLLVGIREKEFCIQAEREKIQMKLLDKNLKLSFTNNEQYIRSVEPFLSRHYQSVINIILSNLIDIEMLKNQKVINKVFFTHKPNVTQKICDSMIKKCIPNPICFYKDYFLEGKEIIFKEVDLLYRYFGESIATYYSFFGHFTIYYSLIGIVGLIYVFIYVKEIFTSNDVYPTYCIIFAVWNLFYLSRWKRKCVEIHHNWGMKTSTSMREIRNEFRGDEYYRDIDEPLQKHVKQFSAVKVFIASLPLILILLAGDVIIFYYTTKWESDNNKSTHFVLQYFPSIIRTVGMSIISFIYDFVAKYFAEKENHKFEDEYDNTLIVKVFVFRLIADLTSVLYSAIVQKNISNLKVLIYTNLFVKYISEIGVKCVLPFVKTWFFTKLYFKFVAKNEKEYAEDGKSEDKAQCITQTQKSENNNNNEEGNNKGGVSNNEEGDIIPISAGQSKDENEEHKEDEGEGEEHKQQDNDNNVNNDNNEEQDQVNYYSQLRNSNLQHGLTLSNLITNKNVYRRTNCISGKPNKETDKNAFNFNPDFIEISNMLDIKGNLIYDYADIIIAHTICALFAILVPFAPVLVFVCSIFSQNGKLYADLYFMQRAPAKQCNGIGIWMDILEIISTLSVVFNCFLYYFYGDNYLTSIPDLDSQREINIGEGEQSLFIVVAAEHVIILIQFLLKLSIPIVPKWVEKEREYLLDYYREDSNKKEVMNVMRFRKLVEMKGDDKKNENDKGKEKKESNGDKNDNSMDKKGKKDNKVKKYEKKFKSMTVLKEEEEEYNQEEDEKEKAKDKPKIEDKKDKPKIEETPKETLKETIQKIEEPNQEQLSDLVENEESEY